MCVCVHVHECMSAYIAMYVAVCYIINLVVSRVAQKQLANEPAHILKNKYRKHTCIQGIIVYSCIHNKQGNIQHAYLPRLQMVIGLSDNLHVITCDSKLL